MAAGVAFDPAEFAAFKAGLAAPTQDAAPGAAPAADAFDPAEFQAFKASRQGGGQQPTRTVPNPMSTAGQAPSFNDRFGDGPMASGLDTSTQEGAAMRRVADEALIGKPSTENQVDAGLFRFANAMGLNVPRNAMAGIEALRSGRSFGDSYREVSDVEDALARQYPKTAAAGTVGGIVGGAVGLPAFRAAEGAGLGARAVANFGTGAGYGAVSEALDSKDALRAITAGAVGGALGAGGGYILDKAAPSVSRLFARNVPFRNADGALTDQATAALREAGIDPAAITPQLAQHIETTFMAKGPSVAAAREAQAAEFGLPLSRGQATADAAVLAQEGRALGGQSGARAQQIGEDFAARQADAVAGTRDRFLGMAAGDAPRIERPQEAYEAVADRARQAVQTEAERASAAQRGVDDALLAVRGRDGADALDAATAAAQGVRDAATQGQAGYRAAYDDVAQIPGTFAPGALDRLGARVRDRLGADVPLDPVLTPAATRAIGDLDALPGLFGLQPGEGPSLQQLDQVRKRLVAYRGTTGNNPTDRRAVDRIIAEFDNHAQDAMSVGLFGQQAPSKAASSAANSFPGAASLNAASEPFPAAGGAPAGSAAPASDIMPIGDTAPLEAMQRARGLFRQYQQTFRPHGPGDTAGANLRRIVERDASPNEVASMLFGSTTGRVSPGQMQTLARLRDAVGADSEPWAAVQRGLIARHLGGEGRDLGQRLDYLLRGEGRTLLPYLTEEQRAGLGRLRGAVQQAESARAPVPTWASDLERTGFDPNSVARSIFGGSGALGAKPGAANEAQAAKAFLGADSQEWAGLRQAAVQRLMDRDMPAPKMIAGLRDFTDGAGKGVAQTLFTPTELGHLRRFSTALQATIQPDGTIKPGAAGEAGRKAVAKAMDLLAGAIAFKVGGLGAAAGTYGAKVGTRAVMGGIGAAAARRSFEGGAPRLLAPPPVLPLGQLAAGEGLALGQQ